MRIPLKTSPGRIVLVEAGRIFYVEARGYETLVRTARRRPHSSPRSLEWWEEALAGEGFFRIHRSYLVCLDRLREIRLRRGDTNDWEVKLDPPVNAVLPMSRPAFGRLRARFGF